MRSVRALVAAAMMAAMFPAVASADEAPTPPQQLADASLATTEVTETDDETPFSFEWFVDENGPVLVKADGTGATSPTTTQSASSSTTAVLLAALAKAVDVDYVACTVTADGQFSSSRAVGTRVTDHRNDVTWSSSCQRFDEDGTVIDVDPDDEDAPPCVHQNASGVAAIADAGLWSPGSVQTKYSPGSDEGCVISLRLVAVLPVDILSDGSNVHGTGSSLTFDSSVDLVIDGVGSWEFCITGMGRQDLDMAVDHVC